MTGISQRESDDCLRCCVATILGLDYEDVPHFVREAGSECWLALLQWASARGVDLEQHHDGDPGLLCIASGDGPRGHRHSVVWLNGLVFDPHPSGAGLVGEPDYFTELRARLDSELGRETGAAEDVTARENSRSEP